MCVFLALSPLGAVHRLDSPPTRRPSFPARYPRVCTWPLWTSRGTAPSSLRPVHTRLHQLTISVHFLHRPTSFLLLNSHPVLPSDVFDAAERETFDLMRRDSYFRFRMSVRDPARGGGDTEMSSVTV